METMELGLYVIRGDNIAIIGELDPELDNQIQWEEVKAEPLAALKH
jgi:U6 snRNA-associated Sm-like protein LSm8